MIYCFLVFNETLTFDLTHEQLESAAFIVLVSNKELSLELQVRFTRNGDFTAEIKQQ